MEAEECETVTERVCEDVYVPDTYGAPLAPPVRLDSYGKPATQSPLAPQPDIDSYGAPAAPVQPDVDSYGAPVAPPVVPDLPPNCRDVPREQCRTTQKKVCVPVARPVEDLVTKDECRDEPSTQCRQVTRARPQKKCVPVDVQKCRWVVRAFQEEVHEKVTTTTPKQKYFCAPT